MPLDSLQGKAAQNFKKLVEEKSRGSLEVRLFPSNQLGGPYDVIDSQSAGGIEMVLLGHDIYAKFSPMLNLAGLPFIFRDGEHAFAFYNLPLHDIAKNEILASKAVRVLGRSNVGDWHRKAIELSRGLQAKGAWPAGMVDKVGALGRPA